MTRWTQRESVTLFTERSVRWVKRDRGVRMTRWLIDRSIPFSSVLMSVTVVVWWWLQEKTSETSQWSAVMGRGQANRWQFYSRTHKEGQKCVSVDGLFVNCEWSQGRCVESRQRWSANWSVKGRNDDPLVDGGVNVTLYHGVNRSFWVNDGFWWLMASSRGNWMNEALNRWWSNNFFFFFRWDVTRELAVRENVSRGCKKKKKKKEGDWRNGIEVGSENELNRIHSFFLSCCIIISFFFLSSFSFFLFPFLFFNPHNQCLDTAPLTCTVCLNRGEDLRNINIVSKSCDDAFFFFFLFSFFPSFHPKHDVGIKGWKRSWIESRSDKARLVVHTYSVSNNF